MGLFFKSDPVSAAETKVRYAEEKVKQCERALAAQKQSRDTAKKNGNYKKAQKCRYGDKEGTLYDNHVWVAERALKQAKEDLSSAKKALADAKKK